MDIAKAVSKKPTKSKIDIKDDFNNKRILFLLVGGFGDILMMTPVSRWIQRNYKNVKITYAIPPRFMRPLTAYKSIRVIDGFKFQSKQKGEIEEDKWNFDLVFNFGKTITYNEDAENMHAVDAYFRFIGIDPTKIPDKEKIPHLPIHQNSMHLVKRMFNLYMINHKPVVGLQLRSSSYVRNWSREKNEELAKSLVRAGFNVVLFDSDSAWLFEGKNIYWASRFVHIMTPDRGLSEVVACVALCDIMICPDSALIHVAQALNKPVIGLYGPFPSEYRMGYYDKGYPVNKADLYTKMECAPCMIHRMVCPKGMPSECMDMIDEVHVLEKVFEVADNHYPGIEIDKDQHSCLFCDSGNIAKLHATGKMACSFCCSEYSPESKSNSIPSARNYWSLEQPEIDFLHERIKNLIDTEFDPAQKLSIADCGCGDNSLLASFKDMKNLVLYGVDISVKARWESLRKHDMEILCKDLTYDSNIFNPNQLDVIILNNILEHIADKNMHFMFCWLNAYLHPDGRLFLYIKPEGNNNLHKPSVKGMKELLDRYRFEVVSAEMHNENFEIIAKHKSNRGAKNDTESNKK